MLACLHSQSLSIEYFDQEKIMVYKQLVIMEFIRSNYSKVFIYLFSLHKLSLPSQTVESKSSSLGL